MSPLFLTDFTERPQVPKMGTCGIQAVKELFCSFDGFLAYSELFGDFAGGFHRLFKGLILGTLFFSVRVSNLSTSAQLLRLVRLADQDGVSGISPTSRTCTDKSDACRDNAIKKNRETIPVLSVSQASFDFLRSKTSAMQSAAFALFSSMIWL